jgi:DNA adenine methylase
MSLPRLPENVIVPPIKCQGIKTKLVPFIMQNICWDGSGRWVEPFLGSGVVLFNLRPQRALVCDVNPHIIHFYQQIYDGRITPHHVRDHLQNEGDKLLANGHRGKRSYYYEVRHRFNAEADPLDFLFLSRACFNGMMRFNQQGAFNVPFCRKPDRFRPAYITKIVNQVRVIQGIMRGKEWSFRVGDWRTCLQDLHETDFVYLDPPYIGRHTDYFNQWSETDAIELAAKTQQLPCGFALSMWKENKYRTNEHIPLHWQHATERTQSHFYHVGPTENLRNSIEEALLIKPGFVANGVVPIQNQSAQSIQLTMQF